MVGPRRRRSSDARWLYCHHCDERRTELVGSPRFQEAVCSDREGSAAARRGDAGSGAKGGALETLQEVADSAQLETADVAWRWMTRPRHWHLQATWSVSDSPWFELMDLNGDQRLVVGELDQFAVQAKSWDRNNDGLISDEEMHISFLLAGQRAETRGLAFAIGGYGNR